MALTLQEAKNLVNGQRVKTNKGEVWIVRDVFSADPRTVRVDIENEADHRTSYFDQTRIGLFSMAEPAGVTDLGTVPEEAQAKAQAALEATVAAASQPLEMSKEDEAKVEVRIENHFLEKPVLAKPARKPAAKKSKKAK